MWTINAVLTGKVARFTDDGETSAIAKSPADGPRVVGFLGIEGDAQADLSVHGGPEKAIHHYPRDHYRWWQERLPGRDVLARAGAFGENISTRALTERDVCIGDRFRLGTALVEVCQGRQPCWKQAHRLGDKGVVATMVKSGRSGWYYRVLEEGRVAAGDELVRTERLYPEWTVERVTGIVVAGRERDAGVLRALSGLPELAQGWRMRLAKLAG
ncbi:MOSC domain-containing protein [Sphingomonas sp. SUN039]|uniref:MOSC domain-containing protein n=1 Tax=Sphingomonas sp. SUN039 TaxID=2937787 RepID=UPI00216464CE|nr:MOSC domain-containing protein [Sphingomonas sp. SUN039]UVO54566.1 MOSC domain-containing protein [Sphingomonas sp. SUN039]